MKYVLITPAKNEEEYIELTIKSVISQKNPPVEWIIVSDHSTDRTDEIVSNYSDRYEWIKLVRKEKNNSRHFASKVFAFNRGLEEIKTTDYDLIGNLDGDISFDSDFFSILIEKFEKDAQLGVAGAPFIEPGFKSYSHQFTDFNHVSGACQIFRKKCFEEIGGYVPIKGGGIDWTAVTTARMKGWNTRTYPEISYYHHRPIGTGNSSKLAARFKQGKKDYFLGGHPLWEILRSLFQMIHKPFVIGGLLLFGGYFWAFLSKTERPISRELIRFHQKEQLLRLRHIWR